MRGSKNSTIGTVGFFFKSVYFDEKLSLFEYGMLSIQVGSGRLLFDERLVFYQLNGDRISRQI